MRELLVAADAGPDLQTAIVRALHVASQNMKGALAIKTRYRPFVCPLRDVMAEIAPGQSVYDVGCGAGSLLYLAVEVRGARRAVGYDISPEAIIAARTFLQNSDKMSASLESADFVPNLCGFDVVTVVDVLHHVPPVSQAAFIGAIAEAMDPGAKLVLLDIDARRRARALANQLHDLLLARDWVHPTTPTKVTGWLTAAGLEVEPAKVFSTLWYGHYMVTAQKPVKR